MMILESGHQWAKSASARVSKSRLWGSPSLLVHQGLERLRRARESPECDRPLAPGAPQEVHFGLWRRPVVS
jgi:hypothetical protein